MKDLSTRKIELWQCDDILEQFEKEKELSLKFRSYSLEVEVINDNCIRTLKASKKKINYCNKEDFIREVIETRVK